MTTVKALNQKVSNLNAELSVLKAENHSLERELEQLRTRHGNPAAVDGVISLLEKSNLSFMASGFLKKKMPMPEVERRVNLMKEFRVRMTALNQEFAGVNPEYPDGLPVQNLLQQWDDPGAMVASAIRDLLVITEPEINSSHMAGLGSPIKKPSSDPYAEMNSPSKRT